MVDGVPVRRLALGLLLGAGAVVVVLALMPEAEATHWRGGTIYQHSDEPVDDPYGSRLYFIFYIRNTYPTNPPQVGFGPVQAGQVGCENFPTFPVPGTPYCGTFGGVLPDGCSVLFGIGQPCLCFGDGTCTNFVGRQVYTDNVYDWVGYEAWEAGDVVPGLYHQYSGAGPWTYNLQTSCCRISAGPIGPGNTPCAWPEPCWYHYNNPDSSFRLEGRVTLPALQPYKRNMKPIVSCIGSCVIPLNPNFVHTGSTATARMATAAETGSSSFKQPGDPACGAPCCSPANMATAGGSPPRWMWDSTGACCPTMPQVGLYSTSVQILGNNSDKSGLEFLVNCNPQIEIETTDPTTTIPPPPIGPIARFRAFQPDQCGLNQVQFTDLSRPGQAPIVTWYWDFGDQSDSAEKDPQHFYGEEGGTYTVTLTVTDDNGLTRTAKRAIAVTGFLDCPTEQFPDRVRPPGESVRDDRDEGLADQDSDGDGRPDGVDNCPLVANSDQGDLDGDLFGNACDDDLDGDRVGNEGDNCVMVANVRQLDIDGDGQGDVCDDDRDGDLVQDMMDNCPDTPNVEQTDQDGDGTGDACAFDAVSADVRVAPRAAPEPVGSAAGAAALNPALGAAVLGGVALLAVAGVALLATVLRRDRKA
jgi:hypothetical protein